jgi:hypothetical protein
MADGLIIDLMRAGCAMSGIGFKQERYSLRCTECGKFKKEEDIAEIKYRDLRFKICGDCVWDAVEKIAKELNDGTLIYEDKK